MKKPRKNISIIVILIVLVIVGIFVFRSISAKNKANNGYIAINTDRTEYLVGEIVKIQITEVDSSGKVNCNANFKLTINGVETKNLAKSSFCGSSMTQNPDYSFNFKPEKTGKYELKIKDLDTKVTTTNHFDVVAGRDLDIVRHMTTRIKPGDKTRFPVKLVVTAKNDYEGEISDIIPEGFSIPWQGTAKVKERKITWEVNLKAGETKEFTYEYSAPSTVPALYKFGENGQWTVISANQEEKEIEMPSIINKFK